MKIDFNKIMTQKLSITIAVFLVIGLVFLMGAFYIPAKAKLAQYLLETAWQESRISQKPVPPWPWADTFPIAKMTIPKIGMEMIVLSGSSGRSLAFAPGHITASVTPGGIGNSLISAHRDTHFQNLDALENEDLIYIERADGNDFIFKVTDTKVINTEQEAIVLDSEQAKLGLITCYPLQGVSSDPHQRYLVYAEVQNKG